MFVFHCTATKASAILAHFKSDPKIIIFLLLPPNLQFLIEYLVIILPCGHKIQRTCSIEVRTRCAALYGEIPRLIPFSFKNPRNSLKNPPPITSSLIPLLQIVTAGNSSWVTDNAAVLTVVRTCL